MSRHLVAEARVGLDVDLPGPAELVEVVDVVRAQVDLQRVEDVADRHAQGHALGAVDVEVQPGRVGPGAVEQALQARACRCRAATIWSLTCCSSARPRLPRSSTISLKPPVVPRPSIGGAPKADTTAPRTSLLAALAQSPRRWRRRSVRGRAAGRTPSSMTYIEPRFGALAFRSSDWPEMPTVCATPGRVAGQRLDAGHDFLRPLAPRRSRATAR